jgi:Cu2+-exporting ATPase
MMFAVPTYVTIDGVEPVHRLLLEWASLVLTLPALVYSAAPFFRGAWRDVVHRRLGMDVPVALGLAVAFAGSAVSTISGEGAVYYDSVTMFIALLLGARYVEFVARRRAGEAIESMARARPPTAERLPLWPARRDVETVGSASLAAGQFVLARAGGTLAADGEIVEGSAHVEESILTGESRPRAITVGDDVRAGSVVRDGALVVRVTAAGDATRLAAIERLAERAGAQRPRIARVADRVAAGFVTTLLVLAAGTAIVWWHIDPSRALAVTFAVLVVSCPCALSLATPAAFAAAAGALSRRGVVVARGDSLETLARVTHVVVDKTGTLTTGRIVLKDVLPERGTTRDEALAMAAALEAHSEHPVARAFRDSGIADAVLPRVDDFRVVPGRGVEGRIAGRLNRLGKPDFVADLSGQHSSMGAVRVDDWTMQVALGDENGLFAHFVLVDEARPGAASLVRHLARLGIETTLLSGDRALSVAAVAAALGIADARGDAQPEDKRDAIARLQARGAVVAMIGDGINDAPSLAQAQVSVSLGSATPLAQWTADVVVLGDELPRIADAIIHARRTLRVVRENLAWAFAYNIVAIPAAALGYVSPLVAAIGMSASSLAVVANALTVGRLRDRLPDDA